MDPNPDPFPEGYWRSELHRSYMIVIQPFIHPITCEMYLSIFSAMVQLNCASTTKVSLPSMPSIERTNRKNLLIISVLTVLVLLDFSPPIHDLRHWLIFLGTHVSVAKFDANYGVSLSIP